MSPYSDFDIDRRTEQAWVGFKARLGEVLSMMDATEPLTLSSFDAANLLVGYVRFIAPGDDRLLALVSGNDVLPEKYRLSGGQVALLVADGWQPPDPAASDETATHFSALGRQDQSEELAAGAIRVLRTVFGVHHPVFLAADVLAEILQPAEPPELAALEPGASRVVMPTDAADLGRLVDHVIAALPDITAMRDTDGDLAMRVGSAMVFVRVPADAQEVLIFAPVVHDVAGRSRAAEILNDINSHARWVRFALLRDRVFVTMSILARPFVDAHLRQAIAEVCKVADGVDDLLAQSLNGRTTFDPDDISPT